jgi:hypothetical protein
VKNPKVKWGVAVAEWIGRQPIPDFVERLIGEWCPSIDHFRFNTKAEAIAESARWDNGSWRYAAKKYTPGRKAVIK